MKFLFVALIAILATAAAAPLTEDQYEALFTRYALKYNKQYSVSNALKRYNTFKDNLNKIIDHNTRNLSSTLAMNAFGDLNETEFRAKMTGFNKPNFLRSVINDRYIPHPIQSKNVDWRTKGVVNPIKNQGACGSCWAFSAIQSVESIHAIKNGKLYDLSDQQLVDCSGSTGNMGCNGGLMDTAYEYVQNAGGICETKDYPYTARDEKCKDSKCEKVVKVKNYKMIDDEKSMRSALEDGPIAIALRASSFAFQFYKSGILDSPDCGTQMDHGVGAVGFGSEDGKDYWIVRNSWGSSWGDEGYIKIAAMKNMCGIGQYQVIPDVE